MTTTGGEFMKKIEREQDDWLVKLARWQELVDDLNASFESWGVKIGSQVRYRTPEADTDRGMVTVDVEVMRVVFARVQSEIARLRRAAIEHGRATEAVEPESEPK